MVPYCLQERPSQVTLLGPSQVPRSSRGALVLESTLLRELNSDLSPTGTLGPYFHHPEKRSENEDEGNRVCLRSTSLQTCQTANRNGKSDPGAI